MGKCLTYIGTEGYGKTLIMRPNSKQLNCQGNLILRIFQLKTQLIWFIVIVINKKIDCHHHPLSNRELFLLLDTKLLVGEESDLRRLPLLIFADWISTLLHRCGICKHQYQYINAL